VAGDYLIAMDPGPTYRADRALLEQRLAALKVQADADQEAQNRLIDLRQLGDRSFDLIDDYLMWIVFHAIQPVFGTAASEVAAGAGGDVNDTGLQRQYILEIRYVAGQLLAGDLSTLDIQRRAELCAASLRARLAQLLGIPSHCIGLKAKTPEGMGTDNAAIAHAVVLLERKVAKPTEPRKPKK